MARQISDLPHAIEDSVRLARGENGEYVLGPSKRVA
jgi:hypothetical protein